MSQEKANEKIFNMGASFTWIILILYTFSVVITLFGVANIYKYQCFIPALFFAILDLVLVFFITLKRTQIKNQIGFCPFISLIALTILFLVIQYIHFVFFYQMQSSIFYILFRVISILIYVTVAFAIVSFYSDKPTNK